MHLGPLFQWNGKTAWIQRASQLDSGTECFIASMLIFNGELYAGTLGDSNYGWYKPYLIKWNGVDAWEKKVTSNNWTQQTGITALLAYHSNIYAASAGGVSDGARLFMYQPGSNIWVDKAPRYGSEQTIYALTVFNDKIYGGTSFNGHLLEWNSSNAWILRAVGVYHANTIRSMIVFNGELYAGTGPYSKLLKWNGLDAWIELAGQYETEQYLMALVNFNGSLFACTGLGSPNGYLLEWSGTAWIQRANAGISLNDLAVCNNKLYAVSGTGKLFCWNGSDAFTEVAGVLNYSSGSKLIVFRK